MKICPITYKEIPETDKYSPEGLKKLSSKLTELKDFPYTAEEQVREAAVRASRMSIQGVQPKLSARINNNENTFEIVDSGGTFILKPQNMIYPYLPENEDLTMRLAEVFGIEVPLHGLMRVKDGSMTYFIKRYDRLPGNKKLHVEDFAQLSNRSRDTKYDSSMEQVASVIDKYATFPVPEKAKLFERTVFNWITGNDDMHLKNFSLITRKQKTELAPAYDYVNTSIVLSNPEETALPIGGKKNNLKMNDIVDYFGKQRLILTDKTIEGVLKRVHAVQDKWMKLIRISFLPDDLKSKYSYVINGRISRLS